MDRLDLTAEIRVQGGLSIRNEGEVVGGLVSHPELVEPVAGAGSYFGRRGVRLSIDPLAERASDLTVDTRIRAHLRG
jgi:hypothetical protein